MKSSIINVAEFLSSAEHIYSAGFSVGYNFDEINASQHFVELLESATYPSPIFSGILIVEKFENAFTVIDGLQRITTICLLLCALCANYKDTSKNNEEARLKILNRFLVHKGESILRLGGFEQEIYNKLLFSFRLSEEEKKSNLFQVYQRFLYGIKEQKISGTDLFRIISKIQFMMVTLDKTEVSVRELYQALNSNKYETQINLISDFISQKSKDASLLWQNNFGAFKSFGLSGLFGDFVKDFLTIQNNGKALNKNALYNKFKSYYAEISKYQNPEKIVNNICQYSHYYLKILKSDFEDLEIKNLFIKLNENNGKDAYPYLMEVLDDFYNEHIDRDVFLNILTMVNSMISSRKGTVSAGKTVNFANLSNEINRMLILKDYTPQIETENKLTINEMNNS